MKNIFRNIARLILLSGVLSLGCVRYQAMPLGVGSAGWTGPSSAEIVQAASRIHHPMLKAVRVNLSDGLNPDEAALVAVALNPGLQVERDKAGIAVSQLAAAGLLPDPVVSLDVASPGGGNRTGKVGIYDFGLSFDISALLNRRFRRQAAAETVKSVNLTVAWREWQVAMAARFQCRKVAITEKQAVLAARYAVFCETLQKKVDELMAVGLMTRSDEADFEAETVSAKRESSGMSRAEKAARLALNQLLGVAPDTLLVVSEPEAHPAVPSDFVLSKAVAGRRPDLLSLWSAVLSGDANYRAAVWNQFPRLELGLIAGRDTDGVRTFGWSFSGAVPIFNRNRGAIAVSKATRKLLLDEYHARLFRVRAEVSKILPALKKLGKEQANVALALKREKIYFRVVQRGVRKGISDPVALLGTAKRVHFLSVADLKLQMQIETLVSALETETGIWPERKGQEEESR
ncbi:MAG: TolC family protein [Acidobacteria bacterium]|nr:TolC family protein [Acidobacteriota bacterium]